MNAAGGYRDAVGLNLDNLSEEEQIEVGDDYGICVKRGIDKDGKSKKRQRKMKKKRVSQSKITSREIEDD